MTMGMVEVARSAADRGDDDHAGFAVHQLGGECWKTRVIALREAQIDDVVPAFDQAVVAQALSERVHVNHAGFRRAAAEEADPRRFSLLGARHNRPRRRSADEQCDELAPLYLTELHLTLDEVQSGGGNLQPFSRGRVWPNVSCGS